VTLPASKSRMNVSFHSGVSVFAITFDIGDLEFKIWSLKFGVWRLEFGDWSLDFRFQVWGLRFRSIPASAFSRSPAPDTGSAQGKQGKQPLALPQSESLAVLKLACWGCRTNPPTLEQESARAHQTGESKFVREPPSSGPLSLAPASTKSSKNMRFRYVLSTLC